MIDITKLQLQAEQAANFIRERLSPVHFIGIGGVGMAALAYLLRERGLAVRGSDCEESKFTRWLEEKGIEVYIGHEPGYVAGASWVVRTGAVGEQNPEVKAAERAGAPVFLRGAVVAGLTREQRSVAVTGTHGKTTTTSMVFQILRAAGVSCSYLGGGWDRVAGGPADARGGELLVAEADESDGTLATYRPAIGVLTNMEFDHVSTYGGRYEMERVLQDFAAGCGEYFIYACEDTVAAELARSASRPISFGLTSEADVGARLIREFPRCEIECFWRGQPQGRVVLSVGGIHNARNALAAMAVGVCLGVEFQAMRAALRQFVPVARRLDHWSTAAGVEVFSDYAHHPTEMEQVIRQVRALAGGTLWVIFQPHRYSRTREMKRDLARVLALADRAVLTPVFAASESPMAGGRSEDIVAAARRSGISLELRASPEEAWNYLRSQIKPGDVLLVLGAGDIERIIERVRQDLDGERE